MSAYVLCRRDTRAPCTVEGTPLSWPLARGAVLIEDADLVPVLADNHTAFLLLMEVDFELSEDLSASSDELVARYPEGVWSYPVLANGPRGLYAALQDAQLNALITTESLFGAAAVAA